MSKIKIKAHLKSKNENYTYEGLAIKNNNQIIYKDKDVLTKITLEDIIKIERGKDYHLIINLKEGIKLKGSYINKYGNLDVVTYTKKIIKKNSYIKITYDLTIEKQFVDTFEYKLEYSIDRERKYDTML